MFFLFIAIIILWGILRLTPPKIWRWLMILVTSGWKLLPWENTGMKALIRCRNYLLRFFPLKQKSSCMVHICWKHLCISFSASSRLNSRNLSSRLRFSSKVFWWRLFCASEKLSKLWGISLRACLFKRICLDFLWGATTIFFFWAGGTVSLSI